MPEGYFERGATRSGRRFARANFGYYKTERELLSHHHRLLQPYSKPSTRYYHVGRQLGSLMQTTVIKSSSLLTVCSNEDIFNIANKNPLLKVEYSVKYCVGVRTYNISMSVSANGHLTMAPFCSSIFSLIIST